MNKMNSKNILGLSNEQINAFICPILLAVAVGFASLYTFHKPSAYVLTVVFFFETIMLFRLFEKLKEKRIGALIYALILAVTVFVSFALVIIHAASFGYYSPMRWFYAQDDVDAFAPLLIAALFIGGGFFLVSIIYYFTVIRFRIMGVMLCTMFPFFLFAKRSDIMPDFMTTLIMLLFLAVIIHNRRLSNGAKSAKGPRLQVDRAYIICIAVFILVTGAITMAVEKPYYQAFLEKNSRLFNPFNMNIGSSSAFEELSDRSSARNAPPSYNYEPLFYMETDSDSSEFFLRTKAFNRFDGDIWVTADTGRWHFYSLQMPEYSTDDIVSDFCSLNGRETDGFYSIHNAHLSDEDFTPRYLPSPYGIITDNRPASALKYYKSSSDTSVMRTTSYYYITVLDDSFEFREPTDKLYSLAREQGFSSDEYLDYLASFGENEAAKRLSDDYSAALKDYTDLSNVSERLISLSKQLTSDCHSDIEKAKKLESYFADNGFVYSLSYIPEDNSVDYFVFESKTGYCAGYATAMTLMARAAGLPARYVEGFAAFEKGEDGRIVIRDGYAHAFVEVYIPAAGWLTFDPTVSGYRELPAAAQAGNGLGILSRIFSAANRISVVFFLAAVVIFFALVDRIYERLLRLRLHFMPVRERIIRLYGNLIRVVGASVGEDFSAYTPDMLRDYLADERGATPERLISLFEKVAFGGYECGREEYSLAYKEYRQCYKYLRRPIKKN